MFSYMLFSAWVAPWVKQPALNVNKTSRRGFKGIYLSHILYISYTYGSDISDLPFLHDDVCFSYDWIVEHFIKCTWISAGLCRWIILHLEKKVVERRYGVQHNSGLQVRARWPVKTQARSKGTVPKGTVPNPTVPLRGNKALVPPQC